MAGVDSLRLVRTSGSGDLESSLAELEEGLPPPAPLAAAVAPLAAAVAPLVPTSAAPTAAPAMAAARSAQLSHVATAPPSLKVGRAQLLPELKAGLLPRQAAWIAWSALAGALMAATDLVDRAPMPAFALALALSAWAAFPRQWGRGPLLALATVGAALLTGLLLDRDPRTLLLGPELLVAGAVAGAGLTLLDGAPRSRWRQLNGALGGAAGAGLGLWAADTLAGSPLGAGALEGAVHGAVFGLVASQGLVASAFTWRDTDRIPSPPRIKATVAPAWRDPCLRAWELDRAFERQAPDPETRDGLGEVAAWVYRLQWTLQALDRELDAMGGDALESRQLELLARAEGHEDPFTRERLEATARHLGQLQRHRASLARERERTEALSEYASAFLEEARAGLALAQVQPGEHTPERLGDVLGRLRAHAAERDAHRATAREVSSLA